MPAIKGRKQDSWPTLQITKTTASSADVYVQLVEHKDYPKKRPRPSPNCLIFKKNRQMPSNNSDIKIMKSPDGKSDGRQFSIIYFLMKLL